MNFNDYWGEIHLIIFLNENDSAIIFSELLSRNLIDENKESLVPGLTIVNAYSKEILEEHLNSIDNETSKTLHFISHGTETRSGTICISNSIYYDIQQFLNSLTFKKNIALNFMNVCYQSQINLPLFKHLFTTTLSIGKSVSVQGLIKSLDELYIADQTFNRQRIEGLKLYRIHY
jgi:hypothetical protein